MKKLILVFILLFASCDHSTQPDATIISDSGVDTLSMPKVDTALPDTLLKSDTQLSDVQQNDMGRADSFSPDQGITLECIAGDVKLCCQLLPYPCETGLQQCLEGKWGPCVPSAPECKCAVGALYRNCDTGSDDPICSKGFQLCEYFTDFGGLFWSKCYYVDPACREN